MPLLNTPFKLGFPLINREYKRGGAQNILGSFRGTKSLLYNYFPLPLDKGKGVRGIGF